MRTEDEPLVMVIACLVGVAIVIGMIWFWMTSDRLFSVEDSAGFVVVTGIVLCVLGYCLTGSLEVLLRERKMKHNPPTEK